jgi:HD-like signal output (HDOD) protein
MDNRPLRRAISRMNSLPSLPHLYREICEIAQSPSSGINDVAMVVSRDPGMSAKVLQLVNSSFFCLPREVSSVKQAVALTGIDILKALVIEESLRLYPPIWLYPREEFYGDEHALAERHAPLRQAIGEALDDLLAASS